MNELNDVYIVSGIFSEEPQFQVQRKIYPDMMQNGLITPLSPNSHPSLIISESKGQQIFLSLMDLASSRSEPIKSMDDFKDEKGIRVISNIEARDDRKNERH